MSAVVLLLTPCAGVSQTVRFDNFALIIKDGRRRIRLENALEELPEKSIVHAAIKRGRDFYLVLGLSHWSRGGPHPRGLCGGGLEVSIDWLHVRDGKIVERQTALYGSCFKNREGEIVGWKEGVLLWQGWGERPDPPDSSASFITTDYAWTFDSTQPEAGISEHATDYPVSPPTPMNHPPSQP